MTREDIIQQELQEYLDGAYADYGGAKDQLERFAAVVADAEAKRIYEEGMVTVGHMRDAVLAAVVKERKEFADHSVEFARIAVEKAISSEREKVLKELQHAKSIEANR